MVAAIHGLPRSSSNRGPAPPVPRIVGLHHFAGAGGHDSIDAMYHARESSDPVVDVIDCGPGRDTVKTNTSDRIAQDGEVIKGAAGHRRAR